MLILFASNAQIIKATKSINNINKPYKPSRIYELVSATKQTTIKNLTIKGMAVKLYEPATTIYPTPKGIVVVGSGNNENTPTAGSLTGTTENDVCKQAADNGYVAAVVAYSVGPGVSNWDVSAIQMGNDFDTCIKSLAATYKVNKSNSIIVGVSYTSFLMLTNIAMSNTLSYCKGLVATCGSTDSWKAGNLKIPVYSINCAGNNEGDLNGKALYDAIPASNAVKALSDGYTDDSCNSHCGGSWVQLVLNKIKFWVP